MSPFWFYTKPKGLPRCFSYLILAAIYYPERTRNRKEFSLHWQKGLDLYCTKFSCPAIVVCGDFNQTNKQYLASTLGLKQLFKTATHIAGGALDLILTNALSFYHKNPLPWTNCIFFRPNAIFQRFLAIFRNSPKFIFK